MFKYPHGTQDDSLSPLDPVALLDAKRRHAVVLTAAAELVAKTASEIIAKQADLMRAEGDGIAKSAAALTTGTDPLAAAQGCAAALHSGADAALSDLRAIQDLMRGFAWQWYGLCVDSISVGLGNGRVTH